MKKFEYKVEETPKFFTFWVLIDFLNSLGSEGWELCERENDWTTLIFKREIKS